MRRLSYRRYRRRYADLCRKREREAIQLCRHGEFKTEWIGVLLRHGARDGVRVCTRVQQHFHPLAKMQRKHQRCVNSAGEDEITYEDGVLRYNRTQVRHKLSLRPAMTSICESQIVRDRQQTVICHILGYTSTHPMAAASCNAVQPSAVPSVASGSARSFNSSRSWHGRSRECICVYFEIALA